MKNTLENKAKFFAQYLLTDTIVVPAFMNRDENKICRTTTLTTGLLGAHYESRAYLQLKPLSSITDEDAIDVAKIFYPLSENWSKKMQTEYDGRRIINETLLAFEEDFRVFGIIDAGSKMIALIDYLRSKGYALPFHNLSVEKQIEYGWVKLI